MFAAAAMARSEPRARHRRRGQGALRKPSPARLPPEGPAVPLRRRRSQRRGHGLKRPSVSRGGPFGAGRACFRLEPEAPTVAASGKAGGRANPDRKVRSGICPALQALLVAVARLWAPAAARRIRPGPGAARAALVAAGGRCGAAGGGAGCRGGPGGWGTSRSGRVTPAGAPSVATGAGLPRDRPKSRCA